MFELIQMMEENGGPGGLLSMLGHPIPVAADPEKVQQLVDMGFERERAEYFYL